MTPEPDPSITYTVKDLLARMDGKLDALDLKLDTKADAKELAQLRVEVAQKADRADIRSLRDDVDALKKAQAERDSADRQREKQINGRRWLISAVLGVAWAISAGLVDILLHLMGL
jgi:predicted ribosome quality control (RQC) complex YloA/Tae2 family protein